MDVSMMKSSPDWRHERETLTTLPEKGSQSTPSQEEQQSVVEFHDLRRFDGSAVILDFKCRSASLSMELQVSDSARLARKTMMSRKKKLLV
ncbi:hypothetical protein LNV47_24245, partial [Paucibacter sp. DJ4R-1]|nr:hypothetical protein [Paucibacter sp. DJ4R-1]